MSNRFKIIVMIAGLSPFVIWWTAYVMGYVQL